MESEVPGRGDYPKVSIIILNWNGLGDTIECLESLKKITYPEYEVIVVDNGSLSKTSQGDQAAFHLVRDVK